MVSVDGRGLLCELSTTQALYCNNWPVPPLVPDGTGYYHSLSGWVKTGMSLQRISVADGKVYGTDASGNEWLLPDYTNAATWEKFAYGGLGDFVATASAPSTFTSRHPESKKQIVFPAGWFLRGRDAPV